MTDSVPLLIAAAVILIGFVAMAVTIGVVMVRAAGRVTRHGSLSGALLGGRVGPVVGELEAQPGGSLVSIRTISVNTIQENLLLLDDSAERASLGVGYFTKDEWTPRCRMLR